MWTLFGALAGGVSPQSASINRSVETTSPAFRSRSARSARCLPLPTPSDRPFSCTSSGPRIWNSLLASATAVTRRLPTAAQAVLKTNSSTRQRQRRMLATVVGISERRIRESNQVLARSRGGGGAERAGGYARRRRPPLECGRVERDHRG